MPTVTASTPMPIMPLLPEFDSLSDDETGLSTRFYAALYATAHRFVTGVRAKNGEAFDGEIRVRLPRRVITAEQVRALTGRRWI